MLHFHISYFPINLFSSHYFPYFLCVSFVIYCLCYLWFSTCVTFSSFFFPFLILFYFLYFVCYLLLLASPTFYSYFLFRNWNRKETMTSTFHLSTCAVNCTHLDILPVCGSGFVCVTLKRHKLSPLSVIGFSCFFLLLSSCVRPCLESHISRSFPYWCQSEVSRIRILQSCGFIHIF